MLRKTNATSFKTNWTGNKKCLSCDKIFLANSGSQKKCSDCRKCKFCNRQIRYSHRKFCNKICRSKWSYENNPAIRQILIAGTKHPNRGASISRYWKGRARPNLRGENNPNWRGGGCSTERKILMGRVEYKNWRTAVFSRDRYTCQMCFRSGGMDLEADHIVPYFVDKSKALDIDNGRTLCKPCHRKTDTWGHKVRSYKRQEL